MTAKEILREECKIKNYALLKVINFRIIKFINNGSEDKEASNWLDAKEYEVPFDRKKKGPGVNLDHYLKICLKAKLAITSLHNQTLSW